MAAPLEFATVPRVGALQLVDVARIRVSVYYHPADKPKGIAAATQALPVWSVQKALQLAAKPLRLSAAPPELVPVLAGTTKAPAAKEEEEATDGDKAQLEFGLDWLQAADADVAQLCGAWDGLAFRVPEVKYQLLARAQDLSAAARKELRAPFRVSGDGMATAGVVVTQRRRRR